MKNDAAVVIRTILPDGNDVYRTNYIENLNQFDFFEQKDPVNLGAFLVFAFGKCTRYFSENRAMIQAAAIDDKMQTAHGIVRKKYILTFFPDYYAKEKQPETGQSTEESIDNAGAGKEPESSASD